MLDSPKWLFFLLFGSIFVSLFVGFIDGNVGTEAQLKMGQVEGVNWLMSPGQALRALTWDYSWLSGNLQLFGWVFRLLNIGFGILIAYQGYKAVRGY